MTIASSLLRPIGAAAAGLTLAVGLGMGAPAHAESRTTPDPAGDPVRTTYDDSTDDGVETETAPEAERVDLVSTRYDFRRQILVVRSTARAAGRGVHFTARVRAGGQDYFFSRASGGRVQGFRISPRNLEDVRCPKARSTINPDQGVYGLRIPVGCFGAPGSARLGFVVSQDRESTRRSFSSTADDANRVGGSSGGFGGPSRLGAALARGADARTTPDAVGDPVRTTYTFDSSETAGEPAPLARQIDLTSTRFDYRRQLLVVRGTAEAGGRAVDPVLRVRATGREYFFFRARGDGIVGFRTARDDEGPIRCPGGSSQVDTDRGTYTLRVPAACFGAPAAARFGFGLALDRSTRQTFSTTIDDANRVGETEDAFALRLGPALGRG